MAKQTKMSEDISLLFDNVRKEPVESLKCVIGLIGLILCVELLSWFGDLISPIIMFFPVWIRLVIIIGILIMSLVAIPKFPDWEKEFFKSDEQRKKEEKMKSWLQEPLYPKDYFEMYEWTDEGDIKRDEKGQMVKRRIYFADENENAGKQNSKKPTFDWLRVL